MNPYRTYIALEKEASLAHLLGDVGATGAMLHFGSNALLAAKNKYLPKLNAMIARKGVEHGLVGKRMNPMLEEGLGHVVGFENMAEYHMPRAIAKHVADHFPDNTPQAMQHIADHPLMHDLAAEHPAFEHLQHAMAHAGKTDVTPQLHVDDTQKMTGARRAVSGAIMAAGALNPHVAAHLLVNKGRQLVGTTAAGKTTVKKMFTDGMERPQGSFTRAARTFGMSPLMGQVQDMGTALSTVANRHGVPAHKVDELKQAIHSGKDLHAAVGDFIQEHTWGAGPHAPGVAAQKVEEGKRVVHTGQSAFHDTREFFSDRPGSASSSPPPRPAIAQLHPPTGQTARKTASRFPF